MTRFEGVFVIKLLQEFKSFLYDKVYIILCSPCANCS